jgi:general secretion pathway protein J
MKDDLERKDRMYFVGDLHRRMESSIFTRGLFAAWRGSKATTGFTLVEVMITLTVLGFILLMISGTLRLGISSWERGESTRDEYQKLRIISQLISQQMKSAVPYKIKTQQAEGDYLAFDGKLQKVRFISTLPMRGNHPGGWVYAIYEFKEGGREGGQLVLYEQRVLNKNFFEADPEEELAVPLLEGVSSVRFEYYREEDSEKSQSGGWVEEWNAKEERELPRMFRMTILQKKDEKTEKELPITLEAFLPANRFEEVRTGVTRRTVPTRAPRERTLTR